MSRALSLKVIPKLAELEQRQLQDDALRTIRQRDPERRMAYLNQIEGIERFLHTLDMACESSYWRQLNQVQDITGDLPQRPAVQSIRRKAGRPPAAREKVG